MNEIIEYIKTNTSWLKDVISIIFACTAIIISILTYKRAKATILQPIRSETIKKQSAIFSELLEFLSANKNDIDCGLDYFGITTISAFKLLDGLGFRLSNHKEIAENFQTEMSSWIPVGKSNILSDVEVISTFCREVDESEEDIGKIRFKEYKEGKYDIEKIYLTKKHSNFIQRLSEVANNPFLPVNIQKIFKDFFQDINENLSVHLKNALSEFLNEFRKNYESQNKMPKINFSGIYNEFNHKRIHHKIYLERINSEIRSLLLVDSKW